MKTTATTKHTAGPWTVPGSPNLVGAVMADGTRFLTAQAHGPHQSEIIANAWIIAAAPALLDALERLADDMTEAHEDELNSNHYGDGPSCSYCRNIARARAAIVLATGGAK